MQANIIETGKNQGTSFMHTYVLVMGLYMVIIIYGQLVATSVASEKSSRAMEVLITTVNPVKMMFGKVLGSGFAALCQLLAVIGSGVVFYKLNAEYWGMNNMINTIFNIPTDTIVISVIMFVLGFFVYAFLYAAIGSLASRVGGHKYIHTAYNIRVHRVIHGCNVFHDFGQYRFHAYENLFLVSAHIAVCAAGPRVHDRPFAD